MRRCDGHTGRRLNPNAVVADLSTVGGEYEISANLRIRLPEEELAQLLDTLDGRPRHEKASERESERFPHRASGELEIVNDARVATIRMRNLSSGGACFLHGAFIHPGERCVLHLNGRDGRTVSISGSVCGCEYVERFVHLVRLTFDLPVHPGTFCPDAVGSCEALLLEDDPMVSRIETYLLNGLDVTTQYTSDPDEGVALARQHAYDLIVADADGGAERLETLALIREARPGALLVAVTGRHVNEIEQECRACGCDQIRARPLNEQVFEELLSLVTRSSAREEAA